MDSKDEIMRAIGRMEGTIAEGFKSTHQRLDTVNGRLGKHDDAISTLKIKLSYAKGRASIYAILVSSLISVGIGVAIFFITHHSNG